MTYEPKEGDDYLVDFYAVVGIPPDAYTADIKAALNKRIMEYHPDKLHGLADEFREKGEVMARLLGRARYILLDTERRNEYDEILEEWSGPISEDGRPIMSLDRAVRTELSGKTPTEVEDGLAPRLRMIDAMTDYDPDRLKFLEELIANTEEPPEALKRQYETALLAADRRLAVQEVQRSGLISLPSIVADGYVAGREYHAAIESRINTAREKQLADMRQQALGGVAARLAILSGEEPQEQSVSLAKTEVVLPAYFDDQASKIQEVAKQRAEIARKRLDNFSPSYPYAELQTSLEENVVLGIKVGETTIWQYFIFDKEKNQIDYVDPIEDISESLDGGGIADVIGRGYNVLTFEPHENLDLDDLIREALQKHINRFAATNSNKGYTKIDYLE